MATATWKQRIITYLESLGYTANYEGPQSRKYIKYSAPNGHTYHIGKAGAVLGSRDGVLTHAFSITETVHRKVEQWEKRGDNI